MNFQRFNRWAVASVVGLLGAAAAHAQTTVFQNTAPYVPGVSLVYPASNGGELGDDVILGGVNRVVTSFSAQVFSGFANPVVGTGVLRFYNLDDLGFNTEPSASTPFYTSAPMALIAENGDNTFTWAVPAQVVPSNFAWTLTFAGFPEGGDPELDFLALQLNDTPQVGASQNWFYEPGLDGEGNPALIPSQFDAGGDPMANFKASIVAVAEVPEPASLGVFAIAGVATLARRRRK